MKILSLFLLPTFAVAQIECELLYPEIQECEEANREACTGDDPFTTPDPYSPAICFRDGKYPHLLMVMLQSCLVCFSAS